MIKVTIFKKFALANLHFMELISGEKEGMSIVKNQSGRLRRLAEESSK